MRLGGGDAQPCASLIVERTEMRNIDIAKDGFERMGRTAPPNAVRVNDAWNQSDIKYSICSLVTDMSAYTNMVSSAENAGFIGSDVEYLYIDNTVINALDGYEGVNKFLSTAKGDLIILCHQDILFEFDRRSDLERVLRDLDELDPHWALCGNTGGISLGRLAIRITDPHGPDRFIGRLPMRVYSLDENLIIAKRSANLAVSADLKGFHLYGTDLCIVAEALGYSSYVVDFHVHHLSGGFQDESFERIRGAMVLKYRRFFRSRWIMSSCSMMYLSGITILSKMFNQELVLKITRRAARWWANRNDRSAR